MKYTEIQTQGQTPLTSFACAVSATGKNEDFHAVAFSADGRFEAFVVLDGEHVVIVSSFLLNAARFGSCLFVYFFYWPRYDVVSVRMLASSSCVRFTPMRCALDPVHFCLQFNSLSHKSKNVCKI